jgi:ketosteroid isomerase-like protein
VVQTLDDIAEHFRVYDVRVDQLIAIDDERVLVHLRRTGAPLRSERSITDRFAQVYSVREGLIARIESFRTPEEAGESVG